MLNGEKKNISESSMKKYIVLPKLFLILTVIFIMWIVVLLSGPLFGVFDPHWTGLSPSLWMILISILIAVFIIIDIILYATPHFFISGSYYDLSYDPVEFPEIEQRNGKQVYEYTYPVGAKGGVFSKTYIQIDDQTVVRVRNQMISKEKIWNK